MLDTPIKFLTAWLTATETVATRLQHERDRGEVTATTAIIVLLVIAAIAAGTIIALRITDNAESVPSP
jgi:hypothetical protein